ncbi:unnamed protein product, partial [Chrysoparadoxa australica]
MTIESPLEKIFNKIGKPLPYAIFTSKDESFEYKCLYSTHNSYKSGSSYNIYQIEPLMRVIGKRLNLFTQKLQKALQGKSYALPVIIAWEENNKQVLLLECEEDQFINEEMCLMIESIKTSVSKWI